MKPNRNAFTLIELLIVCAIIAVLAALLFAAMGPVRERSRRAVCLSNLQQIGHAIAMYRADYDGIDPSVGCALTLPQMGLPTVPGPVENGYVKNRAVLFCPDYVPQPQEALICSYGYSYCIPYFSAYVKERGMETITMQCDSHYRMPDAETLQNAPRWVTKHVQFLRFNGSVAAKEVSLTDFGSNNW